MIDRINGELLSLQKFSGSDEVDVAAAAQTLIGYQTVDA
jgi:hypothetical protein